MFERFTDRARRVLVLAQDEAAAMNHNFLGTEHVLLGLLREGEGVGAKALVELGLDLDDVRARITGVIGPGEPGGATPQPPFTPRAKKVLELALREALDLGHNYLGTEHQLLGLIREGEGVASQVLIGCGLTPEQVRAKVVELLRGYGAGAAAGAGAGQPPARTPIQTPAANGIRASVMAAGAKGPIGSHHYLAALLDDPKSLAAKVLESLGVTKEAVAERIGEIGVEGTSDEIPKPQVRTTVQLAPGIRLDLDDADLAARVRDWVVEGLSREDVLDRLRASLAPPPDDPPPSSST